MLKLPNWDIKFNPQKTETIGAFKKSKSVFYVGLFMESEKIEYIF